MKFIFLILLNYFACLDLPFIETNCDVLISNDGGSVIYCTRCPSKK